MTRRHLLRAAASFPLPALFRVPAPAAQPSQLRWLSVRYRTDPERISRMLPPPLKPDLLADVLVDYCSITPGDSRRSAIEPGPSYGFAVYVAARYGNQRGMLQVGMLTNHEWPRINAREALGFNAKDGTVLLQRQGQRIRASCRRRGVLLHRIETVVTAQAADPLYWWRETGDGIFVYRYSLASDWTDGVLDAEPVELWRVGGSEEGYPSEAPPEPGPRACDISQTRFEWVEPSLADPYVELPVREFVGASFDESSGRQAASWKRKAERPKTAYLQAVAKETFRPWALFHYERAAGKDKMRRRPRGRSAATAFRMTSAELTAYRRRKEILLGPLNLVDFQIAIDPNTHEEVLPPLCDPGARPVLRVLALRVEASDLSPQPFHEAWLFAYCRLNNQPRWYALSHIVGDDGDVFYGRETFGYPSLRGNVNAVVTAEDFSLAGSRLGREFVHGEGRVRRFSTGTSLSRINIVALRARPFREGEPPRGELVEQTWFFQGRRLYADPRSVILTFPDQQAPAGIGRPSPWFEFEPFHVISAGALEDVGMQRGPGRVVAEQPDFLPYYRERCDGLLPAEEPSGKRVQPTFLVRHLPSTRSALRSERA